MKWRIPCYIVLAAVLLYWFGRREAKAGLEAVGIIQASQHALAVGKAYRRHQTELRLIAQRQADSAAFYRQRSASRGVLIRQLDTALNAAITVRDSLPVLMRQRAILRERILDDSAAYGRLLLARAGDSTRADLAEARVLTLEAHLAATLTVASCHILGVKWLPNCPSRNMSLVLGLGTGAIAVLVLHH